MCDRLGLDVWEVIDAAATKPFGFEAFRPGVGPGGHCIPVDPQYLSWKAREFDFRTEFIDLAADTNQGMADYVVGRMRAFADRRGFALAGARVLCLGVAFKPGVSDTRNSRAIRVTELLAQAGAHVEFADPRVDELEIGGDRRKAVPIGPSMAEGFDLVAVLVAHPEWAALEDLCDASSVFDAVGGIEGRGHPAYERL
jgi:UDP-N-acetyl-D-glucosamine dehydrogenase